MPVLKSCCFCGSLRTGTIFAAIAGIVLAIAGIIVIYAVNIDLRTIVLDWISKDIVKIIVTINFAMTILISILLLVGTIKRNMYLMIPWVLLAIMLALGLLVSVLYTSINFYIDKDTLNGTLWLVLGLIGFVIYVYMWFVVFSFFQIIREEYDRGAYQKAPFRRAY